MKVTGKRKGSKFQTRRNMKLPQNAPFVQMGKVSLSVCVFHVALSILIYRVDKLMLIFNVRLPERTNHKFKAT